MEAAMARDLGIGITIRDIKRGDVLGHIPTSATPPHGLACLANHCLVASRISRRGSVASGVIFMWGLNKLQASVRSYPMEAIGPVACMKNGFCFAGGAPGNAYVWEKTAREHYLACDIVQPKSSILQIQQVWDLLTGSLLRTSAFPSPVTAIALDREESMLFSGAEDGSIFLNAFDAGLMEVASIVSEDEPIVLKGHR